MNDAEPPQYRQPSFTSADAGAAFPWPPPEQGGIIAAFVATWQQSAFRPRQFFAKVPAHGGTGAALLYYLVVGILASSLHLFWATLLPRDLPSMLEPFAATRPLTQFLLSPLYLLATAVLVAGTVHLFIMVLVPQRGSFGKTLRVTCYAYSPALLEVIPWVGGVAAFIWIVALACLGIREAHDTSLARAIAAVVMPFVLFMGLVSAALLAFATGAALLRP